MTPERIREIAEKWGEVIDRDWNAFRKDGNDDTIDPTRITVNRAITEALAESEKERGELIGYTSHFFIREALCFPTKEIVQIRFPDDQIYELRKVEKP